MFDVKYQGIFHRVKHVRKKNINNSFEKEHNVSGTQCTEQ